MVLSLEITAMYADDTIVFLSHLADGLLELFSQFGSISGFKVNKEKPLIVFLNVNNRKKPVVSTHF